MALLRPNYSRSIFRYSHIPFKDRNTMKTALALIITMAPVSAYPSLAITQVSNLAEANTVNFGIGAHTHASSFITDGAGYTLNSVTLAIQSNNGSGFAQVKIRADSGGMPGAELEDLGSISPAVGASLITINSSGLALSPNTAYWISVGETASGGSDSWEGTTSTAEVSPGSWTIGDQDFTSVGGGTTWEPTFFGPPNESSRFSVDASESAPPCVSFCASLPNASGSAAVMTCSGNPNFSLVLTSTPVPNTTGQFFFGPMMLAGSSTLGDGLRCVGGATTRILPFVSAGMMMQLPNTASITLNYSAPYASGLTGTKHFQHWFRSGLGTGTGSNTSNAISVTF
jgi:hypothetical protein